MIRSIRTISKRTVLLDFFKTHGFKSQYKTLKQYDRIESFNSVDFHKLKRLGVVYDGTNGGLVLGNSHKKGGICLIYKDCYNNYVYAGEMEGWEYLVSNTIVKQHLKYLKQLNFKIYWFYKYISSQFKIPENCIVIDTRKHPISFVLITEQPQFIINRFATKKHITSIIELVENN